MEKNKESVEKATLQLKNIVKVYGDNENKVQALKGVNLTFRKNEFVSILGPSGCGKTTMLNIIGGLDRYTSGDLIIEGKSTKDYKDKDWDAYRNNSIGFVFQSYNLIPHQTVLGNVELALELSGIKRSERRERAVKMLEKVGLKNQMNKKPNQLSGGQMQRVAIARALINDPEIVLADEPTGALDTETSIQIMELLKEVAKDKLVIMVTHNPSLAKTYSTRIINLLDGLVIDDSNPFNSEPVKSDKVNRKPKMGFKTAVALSLKNLISKRTRTVLTSIAGSIGIIGVALVLALSNGFSIYMANMQTDTLASYPITISESDVDLSSFSKMEEGTLKEKYPQFDNVVVQKAFNKLTGMLVSNKLSDEKVLNTIKGVDKNDVYAIQYEYGFDMNDYIYTDITINGKTSFLAIDQLVSAIEGFYGEKLNDAIGLNPSFVRQYIPTIQEMPDSMELLDSQYDFLYRKNDGINFETLTKNQIVLVVDAYNSISDITLSLLGMNGITLPMNISGTDDIKFEKDDEHPVSVEEVIGKKFYIATNADMFTKDTDEEHSTFGMWLRTINPKRSSMEELEIVGIVRGKENSSGILQPGIAYKSSLTQFVLEENKKADLNEDCLVTDCIAKNGSIMVKEYNLLTLQGKLQDYNLWEIITNFEKIVDEIFDEVYDENPTEYSLRSIGGVDTPSGIKFFAKDFESKERIKTYLDNYNDSQTEEEMKITYADMMSMLFSALTTMVDAVTIVLIAFSSISLIVSSVMIGIITYVSVVERTKEIGVLRSLGASKHEISNVFNAETFLIGLFAGLIGVGFTYLFSIPINIIIAGAVANIGKVAVLKPITALALVIISFILTLISGLIPSRIAAKKDPVIALRSE